MAINGDEQFLKEMKIEPTKFNEHLDAEDDAAVSEQLAKIKRQAWLLNDAAYTIAELDKRVTELRDSRDIWRAWCLMCVGTILAVILLGFRAIGGGQ